jgi:chromosome partitioning protein
VGKTTLTGHPAVEEEQQGEKMVAMMDTDEQMSLSGWFRVRAVDTPILVQPVEGNLRKTMEAMRKAGVTLLIIDTPPAITEAIALTVALADLVVIPVHPSRHDLRAVGRTVDIGPAPQADGLRRQPGQSTGTHYYPGSHCSERTWAGGQDGDSFAD